MESNNDDVMYSFCGVCYINVHAVNNEAFVESTSLCKTVHRNFLTGFPDKLCPLMYFAAKSAMILSMNSR